MTTAVWVGILVFGGLLLAYLGIDTLRRQKTSFLAERLGVIDRQALIDGAADDLGGLQGKISQVGKRFAPKKILDDTSKRLRWAGLSMQAEQFYGIRLTAAILATGLVMALSIVGMGSNGLLLTAAAAGGGYLLPDVWLKRKVSERHVQVEQQLLSFLDMLTVSVESGLDFGDAIRQVSEKIGGILGTEFGYAARAQKIGATLQESLQGVSDRIGHDELSMIIANMREASRMGTPIAKMLRDQGTNLRAMRQLKANELAQKMSVKMLAPVMICIFIPMMIIVMGPALVQMLKSMGG